MVQPLLSEHSMSVQVPTTAPTTALPVPAVMSRRACPVLPQPHHRSRLRCWWRTRAGAATCTQPGAATSSGWPSTAGRGAGSGRWCCCIWGRTWAHYSPNAVCEAVKLLICSRGRRANVVQHYEFHIYFHKVFTPHCNITILYQLPMLHINNKTILRSCLIF